MKSRPTGFWQALEAVTGAAAVDAEWKARFGIDYGAAKAFLRPNGKLALSHPCTVPHGCGCEHDIVEHSSEDIVAVCRCERGCEAFRLHRSDIVVYELARPTLEAALVKTLDLFKETVAGTDLPGTTCIGIYSPFAGYRFPVYLTIQIEPDDFNEVLDGLLGRNDIPFVLLAPTRDLCGGKAAKRLTDKRSAFIALSESVAVDRRGDLRLLHPLDEILTEFRSANIPIAASEATVEENVFQCDGPTWTIRHAGRTVHLPDTKGFWYIALVLGSPGNAWRIEDLYLSAGNGAPIPARQNLGTQENRLRVTGAPKEGGEEVIDARARQEYKERLDKIGEQMDDARYVGNTECLGALELERDGIVEELARAAGYKSRRRKVGTSAERLRIAITKSIGRAVEVISAQHSALGRHLDNSIQTGYTVTYRPESPVDWQT